MPLEKPIEEINEADFRGLIENKVSELKTIEYKQALPEASDADKKEFLADVSSFANASGGHLMYGMKEKHSEPVDLCGLDLADAGATVNSLDSRIRDGIKPRIPGVYVRAVPLANGRKAVVIRVPKSFASPHMVTYGGASRFYARNSNGKCQLDVDEIRAAFLLSEKIEERIRNFRLDRIARIVAGETPVPLREWPKVVLHVVPLAGFSSPLSVDLKSAGTVSRELELIPLGEANLSWDNRFNFEGLVRWTGAWEDGSAFAYLQIFRNGAIETVDTCFNSGAPHWLNGVTLEGNVLAALGRYVSSLPHLGVFPPLAVMITLVGVRGYNIGPAENRALFLRRGVGRFDRDIVAIPEALLESFDADLRALMRQPFDIMWNAAGWARCPYAQQG